MKLTNSTDWPDFFLRRMVAWCCREIGLPARCVKRAQFRNRTNHSYSGHAWSSGRIVCSIGPATRFPTRPDNREGMDGEVMADRLEAIVAITAHELEHIRQYATGSIRALKRRRMTEPTTRRREVAVLRAFRAQRDALLAEWSVEPVKREKPSIQEQRAAKAAAKLAQWQRKLKLAQTKCKAYKRQVAYYEKALAAKRS